MKKTILVIDDDVQIRESLAKVLKAEGYEVRLAGDGREAMEQVDPARLDLLLLDLNLPEKGGWELFESFTSINPFLPIIIITGRDKQYKFAAAAGVGALMEKPLNVPLLLRTIGDLLAEPNEDRLKRLVGRKTVMRYCPSRQAASTVSRDCG